MNTNINMDALLNPKSIAVVGASGDPNKRPGGRPLLYLRNQGFKGKVFPINPQYKEILGYRAYPDLTSVPEPIDLVLILRPAQATVQVLETCEAIGAKAAVIPAAGFAETGEQGRNAQERIKAIAERSKMAILGPNCQGIINVPQKAIASFSVVAEMNLIPGSVAFVSQSGAMGSSVFGACIESGVGFSYYISTGNEACLESLDFMQFLIRDPNTRVIAAYIEGFVEAKKLFTVADLSLRHRKPIVVLKAGRTPSGARAAASHTASLAGSERVYDAVFRQKGILRAGDIDEMFNITRLLDRGRIPEGNRIAMIGISGGAGVLVADYCYDYGFELIEFQPETVKRLGELLPPFASLNNPVDTAGAGLEAFRESLKTIIDNEAADILIVSQAIGVIGEEAVQVAQCIVDLARTTDKLVVVLWMGAEFTRPAFRIIEEDGLPLFKTPLSCMQAIRGGVAYGRYLAEARISETDSASENIEIDKGSTLELLSTFSPGALTEYEGKRVLENIGIPVTREGLAASPDEAVEIAHRIGYPVAIKLQSRRIAHKTEAGIVKLDIADDDQLRRAYRDVYRNAESYEPGADIQGVLVQEMLAPAYEVIVGMSDDPQFGPMMMFGLGGIFVELLKDISLKVAPLTRRDAKAMLTEIEGRHILEGYRGMAQADLDAVVDVLLKASCFAVDFAEYVEEFDINPLFVFEAGKGVRAADALIVLRQPSAGPIQSD